MRRGGIYSWSVQDQKADVASRILQAIAGHSPVSERDAFQLRSWMIGEEALLPLDQIARLILRRESNSQSAEAGS
jgi:hypothetical protein